MARAASRARHLGASPWLTEPLRRADRGRLGIFARGTSSLYYRPGPVLSWCPSTSLETVRRRSTMKRRTFLLVITASFATGYRERVRARSLGDDKGLNAIRRNWQTLLAPGADVALSTEPVKRSKAEWQQALTGDPMCHPARGGDRARRLESSRPREKAWCVCLRGVRTAAVHVADEIRQRHRLAQLLHVHSRPPEGQVRLQVRHDPQTLRGGQGHLAAPGGKGAATRRRPRGGLSPQDSWRSAACR